MFLESLKDDFAKSLEDKEGGEYNLKHKAILFNSQLPTNQLQDEFMYRVSDGEDIIDLIEEFSERTEVDFSFRALVMDKRLKQIKSKFDSKALDTFMNIIAETEKIGIDDSIEQLKQAIDKGADPDEIKTLMEDGITYLIDSQEYVRWAHQKPNWNPNEKKITLANQLIDFLSAYI